MVALVEARVLPSLEVGRSPIQEEDLTDLLSTQAWRQAMSVINWNLFIQEFPTSSPLFREHLNRRKIHAGRVTGQVLYDELVNPEGLHYFDDFYRDTLRKLTAKKLGIPEKDLSPAENPDDKYVGNVLLDPTHQFPIHKDTPGTVSAVVMFPVNHSVPVYSGSNNLRGTLPFYYRGGELIFTDDDHVRGLRQLIHKSIKIIPPDREKIKGVFFTGDLVHGSAPIHPNSPPRFTIACTYFLPGYGPKSRSKDFQKTRASRR